MGLFDTVVDSLHRFYIVTFDAHKKNFVIKYQDKQAHVSHGRVSRPFTEDCRKLCIESKLDKALIMGFFDDRMVLHFSRNIKKKDHQKFRNIWHANL